MMLETITAQAKAAAEQLLAVSKLSTGDIVVVGCSTSEVGGQPSVPIQCWRWPRRCLTVCIPCCSGRASIWRRSAASI